MFHCKLLILIVSMSIESSFVGKKVLVTGVGQGIGKALALQLAKYGAKVFGISKTKERLDELKKECPEILTFELDLEDWNKTRETLEGIEAVDYLICNAAIAQPEDFFNITPEYIDKQFNVNFKANVNVCQIVAGKMKDGGNGGSIVLISTLASVRTFPFIGIYSATKAALDSFGRTMAHELGRYKIRVNMINNSCIDTFAMRKVGAISEEIIKSGNDMHIALGDPLRYPMGQIMIEMKDMINLTLFVLSDLAHMITGQCHVMDGGFMVT